jgi:hypothetical protein
MIVQTMFITEVKIFKINYYAKSKYSCVLFSGIKTDQNNRIKG